jgi:XTP/dITP diphosphohydrolase
VKIILATNNRDKIKEIEAILSSTDVELVHPDAIGGIPEIVEDGKTLEENALKKARGIREFSGLCALADDTGLEVDALDGAPGVYSSRYAGEKVTYDDNNRKLLGALDGVPTERRLARFRCVMALALVNNAADLLYNQTTGRDISQAGVVAAEPGRIDAFVTEGILEGRITTAKRGESGFGFDPVFEVPNLRMTLAEMGPETKNQISHRYRALVEMRELLVRWQLVRNR